MANVISNELPKNLDELFMMPCIFRDETYHLFDIIGDGHAGHKLEIAEIFIRSNMDWLPITVKNHHHVIKIINIICGVSPDLHTALIEKSKTSDNIALICLGQD